MFCDLVGSTEMSRRLDPEDMRAVIAAHLKACADHIAANGGFVAKYMGDGVVAYFGYPAASEQDAENAVRAGLAIAAARPRGPAGTPLQVRVGIATGIVVVGDLIGSGPSLETGVVGDTPNLAARLQSIAPPDGVVIAEGSRRLIGDLFALKDLGPQDLKGLSGRLRAYLVLGERAVESRYEALRAAEMTPIVGRADELQLLLDRWAEAKAGRGQVVWLAGESGVGKSRLTAALMERLAGETYVRQRYFASPQLNDSALHPIIAQMKRAIGGKREDDAGAKLDRLAAMLAGDAATPENAALLAALISLPNDGRYAEIALAPAVQRLRTLEALLAQLEGLARQAPLLLIFEDAHWADPSSVEWMSRLVERIDGWRGLLVVTSRPEFSAPWRPAAHVSALTLDRLSIADVETLIDRIVGERRLPPPLRKDIFERADGVPLFVEEMTKAILEAETERAGAATLAASPSPASSVPATLHASLMARLDRSGEAKAVAQIGAALGREFSLALINAVAGKPEPELKASLDRLVSAGLLIRRGSPLNPSYLFKHALVQDAAYSTLLREPRRALQARIVRAYETEFAEVAAVQPELVARHCAEAGLIEKAVAYGAKAAERSFARSALAEAAEQIKRALALIEAAPLTSALRRERIRLQVALITPLVRVAGQSSVPAREAAERASRLIAEAEAEGEALDDPLLLFGVLFATMIAKITAFEGRVTLDLADSFSALAEKQSDVGVKIAFLNFRSQTRFMAGEFAEARAFADRSLALFDPLQHRWLAARFGDDQRVINLAFRSLVLFVMGYPDQSEADARLILEDAREIGQAATLVFALFYANWSAQLRGDFARASSLLDEFMPLAKSKGLALWIAQGQHSNGDLLVRTGHPREGLRSLEKALEGFRAIGASTLEPLALTSLAQAHLSLGATELASQALSAAHALIAAGGVRWFEAETTRLDAEVLAPSDPAAAEAKYLEAMNIARRQQARSWELRAAMGLARLHQKQGRLQQARAVLAPVYEWFREGFAARDLIEAGALLDSLRD